MQSAHIRELTPAELDQVAGGLYPFTCDFGGGFMRCDVEVGQLSTGDFSRMDRANYGQLTRVDPILTVGIRG